jgi:hypothetical protein
MRLIKGILKKAALVVGLSICVGFAAIAVLYMYGGLPLFIKIVNRPVGSPSDEEYAVYSTFIDSLFSSDQPFRIDQQIGPDSVVYIVNRTFHLENLHPLPPVLGVDAFGPDQDFYQQNTKPWRLQPKFHTRIRLVLVPPEATNGVGRADREPLSRDPSKWLPHPIPAGPFPKNPEVSGVLQLSRVGLDWRRRTATLSYLYECGLLCGQSGRGVILEKQGDQWRVTHWGFGSIY